MAPMKANAKAVPRSSCADPRAARIRNQTTAANDARQPTNQTAVIRGSGIRGPGNETRTRGPLERTPNRPSNTATTTNKRILISGDPEGGEASRTASDGLAGS